MVASSRLGPPIHENSPRQSRAISRSARLSSRPDGSTCSPRRRRASTAILASSTKRSTRSTSTASAAGDVVGIGIHTFNALRGYEIGREARKRGADVVFGGIHPTLYPDEAHELGGAHAVVKGDGDLVWATVLADCAKGSPAADATTAAASAATTFQPARWDLLPADKYMWGSVQTLRGCPKHCSFCSVWRTDGQQPRQRAADAVVARSSSCGAWASASSCFRTTTSIR